MVVTKTECHVCCQLDGVLDRSLLYMKLLRVSLHVSAASSLQTDREIFWIVAPHDNTIGHTGFPGCES